MGIIDKLKQLTQDIDADKLEYYNGKYKVLSEEGPDHNKTFNVEVTLEGKRIGTGSGTSKKSAEMEAAKHALENL